jgi:hypothetical protein
MKSKSLTAVIRGILAVVATGALLANVSAQEAGSKKADAKATSAPRLADGKPNFSGVWVPDTPGMAVSRRLPNGTIPCVVGCPGAPALAPDEGAAPVGAPAAASTPAPPAAARAAMRAPQRPKYKPEFVAKVKALDANQVKEDPALRCRNPGLPRIGAPDAIVHTPGQLVILYNDLFGAAWRIVPTDGRPHRTDADESYLGDSVGRWEGDTLVIESVKFIDDTWLIDDGAFHTPNLKVVETIKFNNGKLEYQATAHDPDVLVEPWQMRPRMLKLSDKPMNEPLPCIETDLDHVVDGTHHDNAR